MKEFDKTIRIITPGKIIISGEHSVVYGKYALATAVDRFLKVDIKNNLTPNQIIINLQNLNQQIILDSADLQKTFLELTQRFQQYQAGCLKIQEVASKPHQLIVYTIQNLFNLFNFSLEKQNQGIQLDLFSEIPLGCGMGSSAAVIIGLINALTLFFDWDLLPFKSYQIAKQIENIQHGNSSGIDIKLAQTGGVIKFQNGNVTSLPYFASELCLVNTGEPESTTGECIAAVKPLFEKGDLADKFEKVTEAIERALFAENSQQLRYSIKENHHLLCRIGVVSQKVQDFINQIEKSGGAAKVCGAGSISGEKCGMVLAFHEDINMLANQFGYDVMRTHTINKGSHALNWSVEKKLVSKGPATCPP